MSEVTPKKIEKVVFGLRKVHYAVLTEDESGLVTYEAPVPMPGAVSLGLSENGDPVEFYADNIVYWSTTINNGYDGNMEVANIPAAFRKDVLGEVEDLEKVQYEIANAKPSHFALLAEFDTNAIAKRICIYNCMCGRPQIGGETKNGSTKPQTGTLNIKARPIELGKNLVVKSSTTPETTKEIYDNWFKAVYISGAETV